MNWKKGLLIFGIILKGTDGLQHIRFPGCSVAACLMPVNGAEFLTGAKFDIRVENHAIDNLKPSGNVRVTITRKGTGIPMEIEKYFNMPSQPLERWEFRYPRNNLEMFERMDHHHNNMAKVSVASRIWRGLTFVYMGEYIVKIYVDNKVVNQIEWRVHSASCQRKAKNVVLMIADGVNQGMITAARVMAKRQVGGKIIDRLAMDKLGTIGHIMTHSLDSMMTDSSNSASAFYTGHKAAISSMGVYPDTNEDPYDDPKQELISELARRRIPLRGGRMAVGIVTTAEVHDATPAALYTHTKIRWRKETMLDQFLFGATNSSTPVMADVLMGGGGNLFKQEKDGKNYYQIFKDKFNYDIVHTATDMTRFNKNKPLLGIFHNENLDVCVDRKIHPKNLKGKKGHPLGNLDALDQPSLVDMTKKTLDILKLRGGNAGFFAMIEAGSTDKQLHNQDFHRAIVDLIEFDKAVDTAIRWVKENDPSTLIVVTADHGHGFDVYGSVDTQIFNNVPIPDTRNIYYSKTQAIGVYEDAGWPDYQDSNGDGYPDSMYVRTVFAAGTNNHPNIMENFQMSRIPKIPSVNTQNLHHRYKIYRENPLSSPGGIPLTTNLPPHAYQDVHSMTEVPVFSTGPGSHKFGQVMDNTQVFFNLADALGLGIPDPNFCAPTPRRP